jgi:DNA-binding CsgD family transcriptional regulator
MVSVTLADRPWAVRSVSPTIEEMVDRAILSDAALTPRETQVLERASLGHTNAEVAAALGITTHAVKFHLNSIFRKLGVRNRTQAAAEFLRWAPNPELKD